MTEIEQLRADIATLEAAEGIIGNMCNENNTTAHMQRILKMQRQKLSRLEAEAAAKADPWREHKEVLSGRFHTQQGADHDEKLILNYAMHLQQTNEKLAFKARLDAARIAELEAQLAKRPTPDPEPTKWGGKADGKWVVDGFGKPLRFYSREAAKHVFSDAVEIVPYTGEQS